MGKLENDKQFQMRVSRGFLEKLDDWRRSQSDIPSRSEAIRRLVRRGIETWPKEARRKGA